MQNKFMRSVAMLLAVFTVISSLPMFYVAADEAVVITEAATENTPILNDGSFETAKSSSVTFEGWTMGTGFEITGEDVLDGNYSLKHTGSQSTAISDKITLAEGANYVISLYAKKASASDSLTVSFAGKEMTLSVNEEWSLLRAFVIGDGKSHPITLTASGNVYIDDITVSTEMIINGDFSTSFMPPWKPHSNPQTFWYGDDVDGHSGTVRNTTTSGRFYYGASHGATMEIEPGVNYIYSGDAYTNSISGHWAYMDFTDFSVGGGYTNDDDIYLRPTKEKQWQNLAYLWNSKDLDKIALRFITENNRDNDLNAVYANTTSYFDNISFKKVKAGENLISDGSFENAADYEYLGAVTAPTPVTKTMENDGICTVSTPSSGYTWATAYHSTSVTEYTAEQTASANIPTGNNDKTYTGGVWYANCVNASGSGVLVDFSAAKIPVNNVKSITFRVYGANDTSSEYQPGIRVTKAANNWILLGNISQAAANGEWADVTLDSTTFNGAHSFNSIAQDGYLSNFELICRENTKSGFYIDDISVTYTPEMEIKVSDGQSIGNVSHTTDRAKDGTSSLKLSENAGAATELIEIEKNTYYYLEGYRMRACGATDATSILALRDKEGKLLYSLTGTMYNQQTNWELLSGTWYSGDNTEIYISAETLGTGDVYYDNIRLVKIEYYDDGANIAPNGSFEKLNTKFGVNGWTLGDGFFMSDDAVGEGYALGHTGSDTATAVSNPVTLIEGANYTASVYAKRLTANDSVSLSFAGQTATLSDVGTWQVLHLFVVGDGNSYPATITVSGDVVIDRVCVSTELIANGEFDTDIMSPWSRHSNGVMAWDGSEIGGRVGTTKSSGANGGGRYYYGVGTSATRPVEANANYIYSGDIYTSKLSSQWAYLDNNDGNSITDVYVTKEKEWQRVYSLYENGEATTAKLRFATDVRSDNGGTTNVSAGTGYSWFDNISFKKVILGESLVTDESDLATEDFETVGILSTGDPRIAVTYYPGTVTTSATNVPEGYTGTVWTASNAGDANGNGAVIDLAASKIPAENVESINFRIYVVDDSPTNTSYPQLRIKAPSDGAWFHYTSVAAPTGSWTDYTINAQNIHSATSALGFGAIADENGYLAPFEITNRATGSSLFYIDDVVVTLIDGKTYSLEENVVESTVGQISAWDTTGTVAYDNSTVKYGTQSIKLTDTASAKSGKLTVEPNTDYYFEVYRIRTTAASASDPSAVISDADGNALCTLKGTLYNQTTVWERLTAMWNSGDNTEVYVSLNSEGTGNVYYDGVKLVKVSYYDDGANLIENSDFESFTGAIHHLPDGWASTNSEAFIEAVKSPVDDGEKALALTDTAITYEGAQLEKFTQYTLTAYVYKADADASLEATVSANAVYGTYSSIAQSGTATTSLAHTYTNSVGTDAESGKWIKLQTRFATTTNTTADITLKATGRVVIDNVSILPSEEAAIEVKTYISDLTESSSKVLSGSLKKDDDGTDTENPAIYLAEYTGFSKGIRMHPLSNADAYITYDLGGEYNSFRSYVAHDGNMGGHSYGNVQFSVYVDDTLAAQSPVMPYAQVWWFDVDVTDAQNLRLEVNRTSDGYPCDGACYADAALYKEYNNELTITSPAKTSEIFTYVYAADAIDFTGIADAEELKVYVNDVYHGSAVPENLQFSYTVDGLSEITDDEAEIKFSPVIDGEEITELAVSRTIKVGGDIVKVGDAYITRTTGISGASTFKRNHSTANTAGATDEPSGNLCIGNSRYVCREGFETHPGSGSALNSAADVDIPVKGGGYKFFRALVGRNSEQSNPNIYDVECIVLADGVQIAATGQLYGQEAIMLCAEIPEGTELITLRTTNYDGQYSCCTTDWLWPVLAKDISLLYDKNTVAMYDAQSTEQEISLADANIHFASTKPIEALTLYSDSEDALVDVVVYRWTNNFLSTLSSIPVYNATGTVKNGEAFIAFPAALNPAEYLITFSGNGTVKAYESDKCGMYIDSALPYAIKLDAWFTETTQSYFNAVTPLYNSYVDMAITEAEKARVSAEYTSFLENNLADFPASFKIGDTAYKGFGTDFTLVSASTVTGEDNIRRDVNTFTHTSGLVFRVESNFYIDYNAYEWVIYVDYPEEMTENSPVISEFNSVDLTLVGTDPYLIGNTGDHDQWRPYAKELYNSTYSVTPLDGKSTDGDSSYFNFMYGDHGMLYGIGWAGRWNMTLDGSGEYAAANSTRLTAGQDIFNTYLKPGETVRTPFVSFVNYDGRDQDRATNLWRRWLIDCIMPRATENKDGTGEKLLFQPQRTGGTASLFRHMTDATTQDQIDYIDAYLNNGIDLTMWWMDTGWFKTLNAAGQVVSLTDPQ